MGWNAAPSFGGVQICRLSLPGALAGACHCLVPRLWAAWYLRSAGLGFESRSAGGLQL